MWWCQASGQLWVGAGRAHRENIQYDDPNSQLLQYRGSNRTIVRLDPSSSDIVLALLDQATYLRVGDYANARIRRAKPRSS
ncbi:hypothetical protein M413DRAFT_449381 [Hebeloma cylindrosporum]|uniref:Uncharacterized protein n=1 Tax=Hebeloma cylindrosporum TaxID=76867 RepID=A0A0C2Y4S8_HEBCY|nr:hypothetical protein M413DRAFT_449381 [Hebeloma cylindrosporum h7]